MNTQLITEKIADVVALLNASSEEAKEIEAKRVALTNSSNVHTEREKRLNDTAIAQEQKQKELDEQKAYIDRQNKDQQLVLNKIRVEKEELSSLAEKKREIEKDRLQLEIDKKELEGFQAEKQKFEAEKTRFAEEKRIFTEEKRVAAEHAKLLILREQSIKQKEERIDKIERMTQV